VPVVVPRRQVGRGTAVIGPVPPSRVGRTPTGAAGTGPH
jgi:hypothetical protein